MPSITQIVAFAALASTLNALAITKPARNSLWDSSKTNTISWDSVNTDPESFDIYLAHMSTQPPLYSLLYANVNKDTKSVDVSSLQLPTGDTYQINLVAHDKPEQIYAQSQQFNVTGEAVAATSTVEGYNGPTYVASATAKPAETVDQTTVTRSVVVGAETTSTASKPSGTKSANANATESSTETSSDVVAEVTGTASSTPTPTKTPNAAVGNVIPEGTLIAAILAGLALLV